MLYLLNFRWLLLHFLFGQYYVQYGEATWPTLNTSNVQILGLFQDSPNASASDITTLSIHSRAMFKAAIILSQQFNISIDGQLVGWQVAQTGLTVIGAPRSTCEVLSTSNIIGIVGPSLSRQAFVMAELGQKIGIPIISYGATDPALSDKAAYPAFYRTIPSDNIAVSALVKLFLRYNWTSCIVIFQNDEYGVGGANAIHAQFEAHNLTVSRTLLFEMSTRKFREDLKTTLSSNPSRIVILWAESLYTTTILQYALDDNVLGPQFLWILSSSVSLDSFNQTYYSQLLGMLTIEAAVATDIGAPVNATLLEAAYNIWQQYEPETFPGLTQVHNGAIFAFDATWTLIQSLQELCSTSINNSSSCLSFIESKFCFNRRFLNGDSFFNTISTTEFIGVSGPIKFSNITTDRTNGTYYTIQNVQSSSNELVYVSILQWTGSDNWEAATGATVIIWPGNSLTPPTGYATLTGVTLRIGVTLVSPFTMTSEVIDRNGQTTIKLVGYSIDLINSLQSQMGFNYVLIIPPSNLTYDQIVEQVANNVYDIVVGDFTITAKRRLLVDFSNSIFDNSLRIILRQANSVSVDLFGYLKPFSLRLWMVILVAFLYGSFLLCLIERRENDQLKERSTISSAAMSTWYTFGNIIGFGADFDVQTAAGRLLTVGMYILGIILVASYTAKLASDLTVTESTNIISGIDDIKNGKIPFDRIGIVVGTSVESYYLREISDDKRNYYPLHSQSEIYSSLLNKTIDASISDTGVLEYETNQIYCNLTLVGAIFDPNTFGIVIPKNWLYAESLDVNILSLREAGTLDTLRRTWFQGDICTQSLTTSASTGYSVESLAGLFLTFFVISILSIILFACLNRSVIKEYVLKVTHRKGSFVQPDGSNGTLPSKANYELSQTQQLNSVSSPAARL